MRHFRSEHLREFGHNQEYIDQAYDLAINVPGLSCEIGVCRGGGSARMIDNILRTCRDITHVMVDPYGHGQLLPYPLKEDEVVTTYDYTNDMRDLIMPDLFKYASSRNVNAVFFNMEDFEFFNRFADGVPVYKSGTGKQVINTYSVVYLDGPHRSDLVLAELEFFTPRMLPGAAMVIDDVGFWAVDPVKNYLEEHYNIIHFTDKALAQRK